MHDHTGYSLEESYAGANGSHAPPYNGYHEQQGYNQGYSLEEPGYGAPARAPSPYAPSETGSTEAWRQRQTDAVDEAPQ